MREVKQDLFQKKYLPIIWIKDEDAPRGKRQLECEAVPFESAAHDHIEKVKENMGDRVFFTDIKTTTEKIVGEFFVRGYL
ncbi:hypothetical protein B14_200150 (plasmid) [Bacillus licheniformis]|uniref:hypothetical protein n=1 Tax=Bacillus licheniformis TaxID=1402 RepID=UPI0009B71B4E|nr:hypothetical protein [Bacillus licheniformis]ARC67361.1 hypothetical protein B14_200150 [Bacillus licheniformis]ARW46230.1 hypothetical protein S100141_05012 [Bacillus licheniformis]MDE1421794.1 hypothetical protein [Bacillus licheniformis]MEC0475799.1 hypothetical protein [Bacillus licheniformis]QAS18660.1 hypothetical protein EQJ69_22300 [Bacillus licheniformis]